MRYQGWELQKQWIEFSSKSGSIAKVESIQWYENKGGVIFVPGKSKAHHLELTGRVELKSGQVLDATKANAVIYSEFVEKVGWIRRECANRRIPVEMGKPR